MKRPQLVSRGSLVRMLQTAEEAWSRKDYQKCIETFERASRLDTANPDILLRLGCIHGFRYDYAAASECFERAIRLASDKAKVLISAGDYCRDFANNTMAEEYFRRAVEQKTTPENQVKLAEFYERVRRTQEAEALVNRALESNPACAPALLARARMDRQAGKLEDAEKRLRSLLPKADRDSQIRAWYELGGLLDRLGRYDEAMAAFVEAKTLLRSNAGAQAARLKVIRQRLKILRDGLSADIFKRRSQESLLPLRRIALLCGHPRSGTTLLEQVLDSHPEIISAEETTIFHDDAFLPLSRQLPDETPMLTVLEGASKDRLQQSRTNYFHSAKLLLGKPLENQLLIDKNPSLTFLVPLFARIFPEAKFLVALRDPRDVCLSCFMQTFVPLGQTSSAYLSLADTVEEYTALMGMWRTVAPLIQNPNLEVRYEDMVDDLEVVSRKVLNFLDVQWDPQVLQFHEHAREKAVRSPTYADVTKPVFKTAVGRWRRYEKYFTPYLAKLEPFAKAFGYE